MKHLLKILSAALATAATGCGGAPAPSPVPEADRELARTSSAARSAFNTGHYGQAVKLYGMARDHARMADDPRAIGNMAYNLAMSLNAMGRHEEALTALDEAESELGRSGGGSADVWLVEAETLAALHRPDEATRRAGQVLADPQGQARPLHRAGAALILGRLACERGDWAEAEKRLADARGSVAGGDADAIAAAAAGLEGAILLGRSHPGEAAARFDRRAELLQRARQFSAMADALADAGRAFQMASNTIRPFCSSASCAKEIFPIPRWMSPCLSILNSTFPFFTSLTALPTSIVTVPAFGLGISPRGPNTLPSLPTSFIKSGVEIATSNPVQPF